MDSPGPEPWSDEKTRSYQEFEGCTLALVDRKAALPGADYVYCFIAVNSKEAWKQEFVLDDMLAYSRQYETRFE